MKIGNKIFQTDKKTYVMGILNVTPDSFSDGGRFNQMDAALRHCEKMISEGADILDIGGESTRPGHVFVEEQEEMERVVPIIKAVNERFDIPISLDTYKSSVAREGIKAGADMINDIWGLKYDPGLADVIAKSKVPCCLMHNRKEAVYQAFVDDVVSDIAETIYIAKQAGIEDDKIILDPGVGFGKTYQNNLEIINCLEELCFFGYPLLLGTSRKSVIGMTLHNLPTERMLGTAVTTVFAVIKGCSFVRVHDVKENVEAIKMAEAILGR